MSRWTIQDASQTYNIPHWGEGYFDINPAGHLVAHPHGPKGTGHIDLYELIAELRRADLGLPVLVRFTDILHDRVDTLTNAFAGAIEERNYEGRFTAIYPIKVNQQRSVVREILRHGGDRVGLEAGSKPELMAVLALSNADGGVIVCNGYKDREYIRLALIGRKLGHRVYIVLEKLSELELVIEESQKLGVQPLIGMRVRLASIGAGKWQNTGGEKSKFGLSAAQTLRVVQRLRDNNMLHTLELLHFHLGSQIANIRDIQRGMRECSRYYAELRRLGADIRCVDVGGGLGVDYEGTRSRSFCSTNYSVREYANNVVQALWEMCSEQGIPHPTIFTESGRAMTAHHAMLITNVIDTEQAPNLENIAPASAAEAIIIQDLWHGLKMLRDNPAAVALEIYHDAVHWLSEAQVMYTHGVLSLQQKARAEELYFATCWTVRGRLNVGSRAHREILDELNEKLADKYFCNLSIFQSMPDIWAIDQIFPIVPLHRLNEQPTRRGTLQDITCDSDGRIDMYVDNAGIEASLPLHELPQDGTPYALGIFLVGAYQEILGDMHNLFGDTHSVNVALLEDGSYRLSQARQGDTVDFVLRYVHFDPDELRVRYQQKVDAAELTPEQRTEFLAELEAGLTGYTYLED